MPFVYMRLHATHGWQTHKMFNSVFVPFGLLSLSDVYSFIVIVISRVKFVCGLHIFFPSVLFGILLALLVGVFFSISFGPFCFLFFHRRRQILFFQFVSMWAIYNSYFLSAKVYVDNRHWCQSPQYWFDKLTEKKWSEISNRQRKIAKQNNKRNGQKNTGSNKKKHLNKKQFYIIIESWKEYITTEL